MGNKLAWAGAVIIAILMVTAILAPFLAPFDPMAIDLAGELEGPSMGHPLGQDKLGRDILSQIIYGSRTSLLVGFVVVGVSLVLGVTLGALAGYFGGFLDTILMRVVDILLAFPGILLAIALAGILGPSMKNIILALCILGWVGYARLVRAQVLAEKNREYVLAAKALGGSHSRIILRHILPNVFAPVIVEATFGLAGVILAESSLSFLGLGPQDVPTWGRLLNEGAQYLLFAPHVATFPGIAIMLTVLGFNFLGDGLRNRWNVKGSA
ncbi:MAG: ABC transporter permease [Deltaproteobacteria bacterium]|nr:MAG: ABC transporter permease [Deltaproteobacteria bacterium]